MLQCTQGDTPCPLAATNHRNVQIDDKAAATILDIAPGANLKTFGTCKATGKPCTPAPAGPWQKGSNRRVLVNDQLVLLATDKLACPAGPGVITIVRPGQGKEKTFDE
jgi:hypothetical protein